MTNTSVFILYFSSLVTCFFLLLKPLPVTAFILPFSGLRLKNSGLFLLLKPEVVQVMITSLPSSIHWLCLGLAYFRFLFVLTEMPTSTRSPLASTSMANPSAASQYFGCSTCDVCSRTLSKKPLLMCYICHCSTNYDCIPVWSNMSAVTDLNSILTKPGIV